MGEKMIGILAGMGPRSTAPFIDLVVDECQSQYGARYDEDFPKMMIYSLPTPFYIDRPINHDLMKKTIINGLKTLEATGVSFIAMPCNSAHIYFEDLRKSIDIPLLNIVEATLGKLPKTPQRVTLFATDSTFASGIYQKGILDDGHSFVFKEEWQAKVNGLIQSIKRDKDDIQNISLWGELVTELEKEHIENVVIACTDLNVILSKSSVYFNAIDSSKCLAEAVVKQYLEK